MKERFLVLAAFLAIFSFTTVDGAISPMIAPIHASFGIPMPHALWLITSCTLGIALGVFVGPTLTACFQNRRIAWLSTLGLVLPLALFLRTDSFALALAYRFLFGLSAGALASVMWWLTYYGVSEKYYQPMVTVLMASRPIAIAIGVPLSSLCAAKASWHTPYWLFAGLIAASGIFLASSLRSEPAKPAFRWGQLIDDYAAAFRLPHARTFYFGLTINRACYFGFYSLAGIWFGSHYGLSPVRIGTLLLAVGLGEAFVNFIVPSLLKGFGHSKVFCGALLASAGILPLFLWGKLPLGPTIGLLTLFVVLDRIWGMSMIISLPRMFPASKNRTLFGSLATLTAWIGLMLISWFEGRFVDRLGLPGMEAVLLGCFLFGGLIIYWVQSRTVLRRFECSSSLPL